MKSNITETYGEVLPESINKLLAAINITENDIFFDLGSGKGKVVAQIFMQTNVKEAHGIEILPNLHVEAEEIKNKIMQNHADKLTNQRSISFKQGSFFDVPLTGATVVLIASPCFSPSMLHALGERINKTPTIHTVLSLRPIATLSRVTFKKVLRVEGTWDTALCYLYQV
jgi:hypothetical protein